MFLMLGIFCLHLVALIFRPFPVQVIWCCWQFFVSQNFTMIKGFQPKFQHLRPPMFLFSLSKLLASNLTLTDTRFYGYKVKKQGWKPIISQHTKMESSPGLSQNSWKAKRPVEFNCLDDWPYDELSRLHCQTIFSLVVARRLKKQYTTADVQVYLLD